MFKRRLHITPRYRVHKLVFVIFLLVWRVATMLVLISRILLLFLQIAQLLVHHRLCVFLTKLVAILSHLSVRLVDWCFPKANVSFDLFPTKFIEVILIRSICNPAMTLLCFGKWILIASINNFLCEIHVLSGNLDLLVEFDIVHLHLFDSVIHHDFLKTHIKKR